MAISQSLWEDFSRGQLTSDNLFSRQLSPATNLILGAAGIDFCSVDMEAVKRYTVHTLIQLLGICVG
jgi:hypothetical protein